MTPVLLHPRTAVMHSPAVAERPVFEARHNQPDFATIYAFLGSLFDPVRAPHQIMALFAMLKAVLFVMLPNPDCFVCQDVSREI